ncbi:MAG: UDP-N-acetylmuramate dehydrogenase [Nitrospirae bacterium]|nr:MAG: UDP-N-acetylmuramate dehydrogenase [Nitrospirota bacterium]
MKPLDIKENLPLADMTTFKVGGPARYLAQIETEDDLFKALSFARSADTATLVLGSGSNVLISDKGFDGLVILNRIQGLKSSIENGSAFVSAGAGIDWDYLVNFCVERNWQGIECLSGIPGTVGAAPVQNVGAYGQTAGEAITEVHAIDTLNSAPIDLNKEQCGFGYRRSIFNTTASGRYVITQVGFSLSVDRKPYIEYRDIADSLKDSHCPSLQAVRNSVLEIRKKKGLLISDDGDSFMSAGSFFKNPVIDGSLFLKIKEDVEKNGGCENWAWPQDNGQVKVSAACLIQSAGFPRGHTHGRVGISPKHSLCIINRGGATATELIAFVNIIKNEVLSRFKIKLEPEVRFIGF